MPQKQDCHDPHKFEEAKDANMTAAVHLIKSLNSNIPSPKSALSDCSLDMNTLNPRHDSCEHHRCSKTIDSMFSFGSLVPNGHVVIRMVRTYRAAIWHARAFGDGLSKAQNSCATKSRSGTVALCCCRTTDLATVPCFRRPTTSLLHRFGENRSEKATEISL